jgi:hypothetical protein
MGGEEWQYIALGDSTSWSFPSDYARQIEADLGIKVQVWNRSIGEVDSNYLLRKIREDMNLRAEISKAEVLTLYANPTSQIGWRIITGDNNDKYDCSDQAVADYKAEIDAIVAEVFALRKGQPTMIRAYFSYSPLYKRWKEWGQYGEYKRCFEALDKAVEEVARAHKIGFARVYDAFNGPNHDQDPNHLSYIAPDGQHTSDLGSKVMAEVFWKLGYEFIIP